MKNFAASTAIALAFAAPAYAQSDMSSAFVTSIDTEALRASNLIGARLYTSETEIDATAGMNADWNDVGEISDIVLGNGGEIDAVLVDIGGFLGIGERTVAVNMDELQFVSDGAGMDDYFVVLQSDQAALEAAPEFDDSFEIGRTPAMMGTDMGNGTATMPDVQGTGADTQSAETTELATEADVPDTADADVEPIAEGTDNGAMESNDDAMAEPVMLVAPVMVMEGYETVEYGDLTADDVTGAAVYDTNDEHIGDVGELVMSADGMVEDAIIDVGGFLGLGEKPVSVPFDQLQVLRSDNDVRVYIDATEEQLTGMPNYEG